MAANNGETCVNCNVFVCVSSLLGSIALARQVQLKTLGESWKCAAFKSYGPGCGMHAFAKSLQIPLLPSKWPSSPNDPNDVEAQDLALEGVNGPLQASVSWPPLTHILHHMTTLGGGTMMRDRDYLVNI